jgi:ribosomal protein S18 acetylase RimI-like enzyme
MATIRARMLEKKDEDSQSMTPEVTRRAATEQDDAFLFALFRDVRSAEFAQARLAPAQLDFLMSIQYAGQKQTYGAQYPAGNEIVLLDGKPIGRMWLYRGAEEHHLVDISLMTEFRNRGIGGALLAEAIAAARAAGVRLCCSVAATNEGSLRFHQRLGFRIAGRDEVYCDLAVEP